MKVGTQVSTKLVAIATSLERSKTEGQIDHLHPYLYQSWKFDEDRSGTSWDNWSPRGTVKKKKTAAEYTTNSAGRPDGLNNQRSEKEDGENAEMGEVTLSRGLVTRSDLEVTLSTKMSMTNRPMTANATYDVISFRTALGAARTSPANNNKQPGTAARN